MWMTAFGIERRVFIPLLEPGRHADIRRVCGTGFPQAQDEFIDLLVAEPVVAQGLTPLVTGWRGVLGGQSRGVVRGPAVRGRRPRRPRR
jgi:hypothetical protein